jgi:hypothetical protein
MSRKHFSWLLFLTFLAALLVLLLPGRTGKESGFETSILLKGMQEQVNDLDWLRLSGAGGVTVATLDRSEAGWTVIEAAGYRADWSRLKSLLANLSQAEITELKTSNAQYYERLGVEDTREENAAGVLIEFSDESGLPAVIIGNRASGREGQYVRLRDAAQSVLIDRQLNLPAGQMDWLESEIIDISSDEVVEVEINHPDGDHIRVSKASADDEDFLLESIPEGFELKSAWTVNSLGNALTALTLDSVAGDEGFDWTRSARYRVLTADGLLVEAELLAQAGEEQDDRADDSYWIRLNSSLYQTAVESSVESAEEPSDTARRAAEINSRVQGWAYRIPKHKFDSMTRRQKDLLQVIEHEPASL